MKKIIILTLLVFFTNSIFAQDYNKLAESAAKDLKVSPTETAKFKETYIASLKKEQNKKTVPPRISETTDICDDGGFESKDFSNWGWTMVDNRHESAGIVYNSTITGATGRLLTKLINTDMLSMPSCTTTVRHANSSWEIVSAGLDSLIASLSTVHSGNYALKLGDKPNFLDCSDYPWKSAESVKKSITVTATNNILKFWYAVVTNDASSLTDHCCGAAAGFGVRVNGIFKPIIPVPVGSSNDPIYAYNNPGLTTVSVSGRSISYLPWGCSSVDLSQYIGQTVTIEFNVFDCIHTGHFAYAYIDDICMGCDNNPPPDPCCQNTLQMVTATAVPPSYPYNEGTYGVEQYNITAPSNIPITEIRVNVMSFEWKSDKEDCKQCQIKPSNLGSLFGGIKIGGVFTGPTTQPYGVGTPATANNNEVVFSFPGGGKNLAVGDFMRLTYLLPPEKDLSCCQTKAHVCFKVSWKDINCGYCEVFTCSDIDLKNPSELRAGFPLPDRLMLYLNSRNLFPTGHAEGF